MKSGFLKLTQPNHRVIFIVKSQLAVLYAPEPGVYVSDANTVAVISGGQQYAVLETVDQIEKML